MAFLVKKETRYPGEQFSIPVSLTGYNFGRVAGTVYTNVVGLDYRDVINKTQHAQSARNISSCTNLQYSIISQQNQTSFVVLALTAQEQFTHGIKEFKASVNSLNSTTCINDNKCIPYLTTPVYIRVTLEECPLGFMLNKQFGICDCDQTIKDLAREDGTSLTCEIQNRTGYVTRQGKIWFGIGTHLYYKYGNCPRDYCDRAELTIDLREPDTQCRLNRSGVLCGSCQNGYSLQLGNNNCAQCNNKTVVLLIVFAILGILLVALLTTLDLTVASGTINGLIFYANIVWINNAILFPVRERLGISYYIITVPIAWINLDFGIETCFSENLDQLAKSGMQFVFPVYIWCIAGLIILICHYSTRATRLFGNNSVAVLATLFLLSYGKLFRSITDVFIPAYVANSTDNTRSTVWALDGNVTYNDSRHISLIAVALLFLILFWLPFTFTILLIPFLRAKSNKKLLRWINTLQPFFDTFYGPFKHKKIHQIWTGILLLSRAALLVVNATTSAAFPNAGILVVALIASLLLVYTTLVYMLYKNWFVSLLEVLYLLNLIILSVSSLIFPQTNKDNILPLTSVVTLSLCVTLLQFGCTVIFHTVKRVIGIRRIRKRFKLCITLVLKQEQNWMASEENEPTVLQYNESSNTLDTSTQLRESLLS